jgi:hypothetical protein
VDVTNADLGHRNPDIKDSFYFLMFSHTFNFEELMNKPYDSQGVYSFHMLRQGIVMHTLIDEYVPTLRGRPIYTPPFNNRLYPALIEKALAKIYSSYIKIPKRVPEIMENLSLFPKKVMAVPHV